MTDKDNPIRENSWAKVVNHIDEAFEKGYKGIWGRSHHILLGLYVRVNSYDLRTRTATCDIKNTFVELPVECLEIIPDSHKIPKHWYPSQIPPHDNGRNYKQVLGIDNKGHMCLVIYNHKTNTWYPYSETINASFHKTYLRAWSYVFDWPEQRKQETKI